MVGIFLNDEAMNIETGSSLTDVLRSQAIAENSVALVLNGEVVPRSRWAHIVCQQDDTLDVFSVVAGG